jgi:hypothetical protein
MDHDWDLWGDLSTEERHTLQERSMHINSRPVAGGNTRQIFVQRFRASNGQRLVRRIPSVLEGHECSALRSLLQEIDSKPLIELLVNHGLIRGMMSEEMPSVICIYIHIHPCIEISTCIYLFKYVFRFGTSR